MLFTSAYIKHWVGWNPKTKCVGKFHTPPAPQTHTSPSQSSSPEWRIASKYCLALRELTASPDVNREYWRATAAFHYANYCSPKETNSFMQLNCLQAYLFLNNGLAWVIFVSAGTKHLSKIFLLSTHACELVLWKGLTGSFLCKDSFLYSNEFSIHEAHFQGLRKIKTLSNRLMQFRHNIQTSDCRNRGVSLNDSDISPMY